jgi:hypothetical protein
MRKNVCFLIFLGLSVSQLLQARILNAQTTIANSEPGTTARTTALRQQESQLNSPAVSRFFFNIAYELAHSENVSDTELEQAIVFLTAAMKLDGNAKAVRPLLLELCCKNPGYDHTDLVNSLFLEYVDKDADIELSRKALAYLLEKLQTRQQRQQLLEKLLVPVGKKNTFLGSEIAMMLGMIEADKANLTIAQQYLVQAYRGNRYNKQAFQKLQQLAPDQIVPMVLLERERLALRENPTDLDSALAFAGRAERLQMFETAALAYEYSADLYEYLYPSAPLDVRIYLPWAISCYNTRQDQSKCLEILERVRGQGRFDFTLESIAGRAALKIGKNKQAEEIILGAAKKAEDALSKLNSPGQPSDESVRVTASELSWFYCFVLPTPDRALDWANKARSAEPASPAATSLFAYALMMNNEISIAKPVIEKFERSQISDLAMALIQIKQSQKAEAIETLKVAIEKDPSSFAAERARELMAQQGETYSPKTNPDAIVKVMSDDYGKTLVPPFTKPEEILAVDFKTDINELPYGDEFNGIVTITNNSQESLIINDDALFKGNIRVEAVVSGDLSTIISKPAVETIRTARLIDPGQNMSFLLVLNTGQLRNMLLTYPQASLNIEFTLYLDPVQDDQGRITNRLTYLKPIKATLRRPAIQLTGQYLKDRYMTISQNRTDEKIKTAGLFVGLLKELNAWSGRTPSYRFMYNDWVPSVLNEAITHQSGLLCNPSDAEWGVKVYTMSQLLSLPLDYKMVQAVAQNLNNDKWPVRLMAVYLLAKSGNKEFRGVLEWVAKNDTNESVRTMASALNIKTAM